MGGVRREGEGGGRRKEKEMEGGWNEAEGLETVHQAPYQLRASDSKGGADGDLTYLGSPLGSNTHILYTQNDCSGEGKINLPVHPFLSTALLPNVGWRVISFIYTRSSIHVHLHQCYSFQAVPAPPRTLECHCSRHSRT